jgi:hypothetical protein
MPSTSTFNTDNIYARGRTREYKNMVAMALVLCVPVAVVASPTSLYGFANGSATFIQLDIATASSTLLWSDPSRSVAVDGALMAVDSDSVFFLARDKATGARNLVVADVASGTQQTIVDLPFGSPYFPGQGEWLGVPRGGFESHESVVCIGSSPDLKQHDILTVAITACTRPSAAAGSN